MNTKAIPLDMELSEVRKDKQLIKMIDFLLLNVLDEDNIKFMKKFEDKLVNSIDASGNLHNYLKINQNGTLHKNLLILIDNFDLVCGKIVTKLEFSNLYKD